MEQTAIWITAAPLLLVYRTFVQMWHQVEVLSMHWCQKQGMSVLPFTPRNTYFIPRFGGYATTDTHNLVFPTNFDCHRYKCYALLCYIVMTQTNVDLLICYLGHFKNKHLHDYHNDILLAIKTSTKRNPPTEAQQTQLHGFLPSTYWPYWIPNLSMLW